VQISPFVSIPSAEEKQPDRTPASLLQRQMETVIKTQTGSEVKRKMSKSPRVGKDEQGESGEICA